MGRFWWVLEKMGGVVTTFSGTVLIVVAIGRYSTHGSYGITLLDVGIGVAALGVVVYVVGVLGQQIWGPRWVHQSLGPATASIRTISGNQGLVVLVEIDFKNLKPAPLDWRVKSATTFGVVPDDQTLFMWGGQALQGGNLHLIFTGFQLATIQAAGMPSFMGCNLAMRIEYKHPKARHRRFLLMDQGVLRIHDLESRDAEYVSSIRNDVPLSLRKKKRNAA